MTNHESGNRVIAEFMEWRSRLKKEVRGGILMYDVPGHYKWLDEKELLEYYNTQKTITHA